MAFSKVKVGGLADDSVTAANIDDDGTGYTVGNLTNSGTLQQTGQVTLGSGGTNWTLPTARGTNKYVLQIQGGAANWAESLTAPELSGHNFDVSGSTDDGGINAYEAPYELTGTTNQTTTISAINTTNLLVGQYISGAGIPADTTISAIPSPGSSGSITISNAVTVAGTQTSVALKIQKTPGEKNGGKVTLTGANFGATIGEITVAITDSGGGVIANASYLSGLSGGNTIVAEWTGTEGTYSTNLTSSYSGSIYFKMTKSGLSSNVLNTNTTLTSDPAVTALTGSSQTGGDISTDPTSSSLGEYGSGRTAGGAQDSDTKLLLNFDRGGGTDIEDSSNTGGDGHKITANGNAAIKASPFGDGKSAIRINGSTHKLQMGNSTDFNLGTSACVEFWIYQESTVSPHNIINHGGVGTADYNGWTIGFQTVTGQDDGINFYRRTSGTTYTLSSGGGYIRPNSWHHVAYTRDGTTARIFIDGKLRNSGSDVTATVSHSDPHNKLKIGIEQAEGGGRFAGYIDEIRIVNGSAVYTSDFTVPTSRLTAITNTKLLIHSNINLDSSDSTHQVIHEGNATYNTTSSKWSNRSAMYFDGTSGTGIRIPQSNDFDFGNNAFTVRGWVKPSSASGNEVIFSTTEWNGNDNADGTALMLRKSGSKWYLNATNTSHSGWAFETASTNNVTTSWQHFVVTKASGTAPVKLIIDGTEEVSQSITTIAATSGFNNKDFFLGGYIGGQRFTGYISDFEVLKGESTTTSPINSETTKSTNTKLLLLGTTAGLFADSATSGTTHTITPTGSYHSHNHRGIATALAWPASGKLKGTSGIYLDGNGDYLEIPYSADLNYGVANQALSIDMWIYPMEDSTNGHCLYMQGTDSNNRTLIFYYGNNNGNIQLYTRHGSTERINVDTSSGTNTPISVNQWNHIAVTRDTSGVHRIYINGKYQVKATDNTTNSLTSNHFIGKHAYAGQAYFKGYIDNVRFQKGVVLYTGSNQESTTNAYTVPTRAYGAYGTETPDVGTITLTATGEGDFTWSEVAGGTALPGTLAVGSTAHSGSGNSRTHTATITGTLPTFTSSTFTNGVRSDLATNNILLKVQHDTDATKAVTLNGATGVGITQKSTGKPILFNARRFMGTGTKPKIINGFGFSPDVLWIKNRDRSHHHRLFDTVQGVVGTNLVPDDTDAQATNNNAIAEYTSDGFRMGDSGDVNIVDEAHIAWAWKAGGAPSGTLAGSGASASLTNGIGNGTIHNSATGVSGVTSITQSVNQNSGFSITKYTGGAGAQNATSAFPHNLGGTPDWIMVKNLSGTYDWVVYHKDLTTDKNINLNNTAVEDTKVRGYIDAPDSTNINLHASTDGTYYGRAVNRSGDNFICYAWKAVPGVSAFGTHTGQISSVSGEVVGANGYCGFKPRMVIIRCIDTTEYWLMFDKFRETTDTFANYLFANESNAESASSNITVTVTTNGFTTGTASGVGSGSQKYISMAFA